MTSKVYMRKVDTRDELLAFWMLLPTEGNVKISSDEQCVTFAHK
jgi:hypothetical protein